MLQKEGYLSPLHLWTALQTSWFYLPWPWSDCGAGLRATSPNTKEFFQGLYRTVCGSMRFPFCFFQGSIGAPVILNPAPQVRHLWLTPRLEGRRLWFPHSQIVNSPECGSTNLHFSISRGLQVSLSAYWACGDPQEASTLVLK